MKINFILLLTTIIAFWGCQNQKTELRIIETTDVHGHIFNYDFARDTFRAGSLMQLSTYLNQQNRDNLVLLDNGDIIQGDPVVYYANYVDTTGEHLLTQIFRDLKYDAATIGNHDIEAGPAVYNKIKNELTIPWLGANIITKKSGKQAFKPYTIIKKNGLRIGVLGIITPGIPTWLPEKLYKGLEFMDMVKAAKKWMPKLKNENPDIIIGLFHAGLNPEYGGYDADAHKNPNAVMAVAKNVPGFDIIFSGHDHRETTKTVTNTVGKKVTIVNGGSHGKEVGEVKLTYNHQTKTIEHIEAKIEDISNIKPDAELSQKHQAYLNTVKDFFNQPVGKLQTKLCPQEALFGPSAFMQFIHEVQLHFTNADVSLSAPLQIYNCIDTGTIYRSDIFSLYRYENYLASMNMTVKELDSFLEYAVKNWFSTMKSTNDELLQYDSTGRLENAYYNFSSALGVEYTIDVTKQNGDKVEITKVKGQKSFKTTDTLRVALNSYRMVGGGGHLPNGAGINRRELENRNVWLSETPIKTLMMQYFEKKGPIKIDKKQNWQIIPQNRTKEAIQRERINFYNQ